MATLHKTQLEYRKRHFSSLEQFERILHFAWQVLQKVCQVHTKISGCANFLQSVLASETLAGRSSHFQTDIYPPSEHFLCTVYKLKRRRPSQPPQSGHEFDRTSHDPHKRTEPMYQLNRPSCLSCAWSAFAKSKIRRSPCRKRGRILKKWVWLKKYV